MLRFTIVAVTLTAAGAGSTNAQTIFGSGGVLIPAQPSCQMRLPDQCLPVGNKDIMRQAAAKSAYVVPAIEANQSWETVHRLNAMLAKRRDGVFPSSDLTAAANSASDELKGLRKRAEGEYKLPYLSAGMNGFLGAAAGLAPGGWQILTKPTAAVGAEVATDILNHSYTDYTRPEKQYELFQRNLDAELNSSETVATAFAVAARDPDFAKAMDYELRDTGVSMSMTPAEVRRTVMRKNPSLKVANLKDDIAKSDRALMAGLATRLNNAGKATIDALKEEFTRQDAIANKAAYDEKQRVSIELRRHTAYEAAEGSLILAVQIVGMSDPHAAAKLQSVGSSALKIYDTVDHFSAAIHSDKLTSTLGAAAMSANIAVIGLALISSFANQGPDANAVILQQIQAIQQQLTELRKLIDDHFLQTDLRLASMTQVMVDNFAQIHQQLATSNFDAKTIYDKTDKILSSVHGLAVQIDDRFQEAIDVLGAAPSTCFDGPINYPDLTRQYNQLLSIHGQCLNQATTMVTKQSYSKSLAGEDIEPTSHGADAILEQMELGLSTSPIPSWSGVKVRPLQMAAVADGLSAMPTVAVPDPASWMAYADQYVNFSMAFEPIRRKLGVNPTPQTRDVIRSGVPLASFYSALRPSTQTAAFYYKRIDGLRQANIELLRAIKALRRDFEAIDGLKGWSIDELKWLSAGAVDDQKPTGEILKFAPTLKPAYANTGIVNLAPCADSTAKETLTLGAEELPAVDPLHVILEQVDKRPITMCYKGTLESPSCIVEYNDRHDTTWFYRSATVRIQIVALSGNDTLATRDWVTKNPVRYSADEYNCKFYYRPAAGQNALPEQVITCPSQDFLDYWIKNHELRGDANNVLGPIVHNVPQAVDFNLVGLGAYLNGHTLNNVFTTAETVVGSYTAANARARLAGIVTEQSNIFGDIAYEVALNSDDVAATGTGVPLHDMEAVKTLASKVFVLKAAIGVYLQLGTPALFESDAGLVELFYGRAGRRLLDPYAIQEMWRGERGRTAAPDFEAELMDENVIHSTATADGIKRMMESGQADSPKSSALSFSERFQKIQNSLTLLRILQDPNPP